MVKVKLGSNVPDHAEAARAAGTALPVALQEQLHRLAGIERITACRAAPVRLACGLHTSDLFVHCTMQAPCQAQHAGQQLIDGTTSADDPP